MPTPSPTRSARLLAAAGAIAIIAGLLLASSVPNLVFSENLLVDTIIRKIGHFVAFFAFAVAGCLAVHGRLPSGRAARLVIVAAIGIALADELRQTQVAGRLASPIDVGIDVAGAVTGAFAYRRRVEAPER